MHGEYSDCAPDQNFICKRCTALDEDALFAKVEQLSATIERVRVLADQYAATAEVHANVRDTMPHTDANVRPHVQAKALAGMAQHHADQLHAALATP